MHRPTQTHWTAAKRLLRYLKGTIYYGLVLKKHSSPSLYAFSDADWGGNKDNYTSTSAYIIYFGRNAVSWCSRKQRTVARSSTEAEYHAVAAATSELIWVQSLLSELGVSLPLTPTVYCNNVGTTYFCANPVFHSHMKHIVLDYYFVHDKVSKES